MPEPGFAIKWQETRRPDRIRMWLHYTDNGVTECHVFGTLPTALAEEFRLLVSIPEEGWPGAEQAS